MTDRVLVSIVDNVHTYKTTNSDGSGSVECLKDGDRNTHHNPNGPAFISTYPNGTPHRELYLIDGNLHREGDLPASIIYAADGSCYHGYCQNDEFFREDDKPNYIIYNEKGDLYTEYWRDPTTAYLKLHRTTGPAVITHRKNGETREQFFVNGVRISLMKFIKKYFPEQYEAYAKSKQFHFLGKKYKVSQQIGTTLILELVQ